MPDKEMYMRCKFEKHLLDDGVYIFGSGARGKNVYSILKQKKIAVHGFIDNDASRHGHFLDTECTGLDAVLSKGKKFLVVVSPKDNVQICKQLDDNDVCYILSEEIVPLQSVSYNGYFTSFQEAESYMNDIFDDGGYDSDTIFKKVSESTLAVLKGKATFERDSFLFYKKEVNYNLMMYLYKIFIKENHINVLDFGGALGSTYLQHKEELSAISADWTITEQPHFVEFGKHNLSSEHLHFATNSDLEWNSFNILFCSGVLQYLEDDFIKQLCDKKIKNIIIERTSVSDHDRYWLETVHEPIYEAMYPCRVFEEQRFIHFFMDNGYKLVDSWHSLVDGDVKIDGKIVQFKSFVFTR